MPTLSKSKLLAWRQCPKRLWLELHRPDLGEAPEPPARRFQVGLQVGDLARHLYDPEGKGSGVQFDAEGFQKAITRTQELVAQGNPIFGAGFKTEDASAFADVLVPEEQESWKLVEAKNSTEIMNATGVRDELESLNQQAEVLLASIERRAYLWVIRINRINAEKKKTNEE